MLLAIIPVGILLGLLLSRVHLYLVPRVYESEVIIQITQKDESSVIKGAVRSSLKSQFMTGTEFEPFKSSIILSKVSDKLKLKSLWGVDEEAVLVRLKDAVQVTRIRGTDLISVKVRVADPVEARDIASELALAYKEWREAMEKEGLERMLTELRRAVQKQEDEVEEARKELEILIKSKGSDIEFIYAKRNFEHEAAIFEQMKLKLVSETMDTFMSSIVVHEHPEISNQPVGLSERFLVINWIAGGALFAPLLALPMMVFLNRRQRVAQV